MKDKKVTLEELEKYTERTKTDSFKIIGYLSNRLKEISTAEDLSLKEAIEKIDEISLKLIRISKDLRRT